MFARASLAKVLLVNMWFRVFCLWKPLLVAGSFEFGALMTVNPGSKKSAVQAAARLANDISEVRQRELCVCVCVFRFCRNECRVTCVCEVACVVIAWCAGRRERRVSRSPLLRTPGASACGCWFDVRLCVCSSIEYSFAGGSVLRGEAP